jgi:Acyl-CoA synthetases (AMP-forming)/AMP-acid ligases II
MDKLLNITIGQMLEETCAKFPTRQAIKYIEMKYDKTWYEFNSAVDEVAKGLLGMGIKKGDHVAVWATNYPQWVTLFFATAKIGAILVTVNTNYKEHELEYLLKQSDSRAVFICDGIKDIDCEKIIYSLCPELKECKKGELVSERLPELKYVVSFDNYYPGMFHWTEIERFGVLISDEEYAAAKADVKPDDVVNMQYTSGTTGFPKGVMLTHNNIVNNGFTIGDGMKFTENDRLCINVPFFHCFGMVLAIMACVTHGTTMLPLLFYTPMKVMHVIEYERATAMHGVPTMFVNILSHRDFDKYDFSTLRTGIMAGSRCPESLLRQVTEKMNMKEIVSVYGLTEASPGCTMTKTTDTVDQRCNTVGTPFPFVETKVVDPETGEEVPAGVQGEFCARGYNIMKGYYNMPEETAKVIDKDGFLHTGDLATVDEQGYYRITGRIKEMIIRGGENLFPKELEDFLYTHHAVKDVSVFGVSDEKYGEEAVAHIILNEGVEVPTEDDIKKFVGNALSRHKIPRYVEFVNEFILNGAGKIQKFKMREEFEERRGIKVK